MKLQVIILKLIEPKTFEVQFIDKQRVGDLYIIGSVSGHRLIKLIYVNTEVNVY